MKRILTLIAVLFAGLTLSANEEAVKATVTNAVKATTELDIDKALGYYHPQYKSIGTDGKTVDINEVKQMAPALRAIKNITTENWTVLDFMELIALFQGQVLTDAQRQQFKAMNNDAQTRNQMAETRKQVLPQIMEMQKMFAESFKTFKIKSVKVNGNSAVVVYVFKNPIENVVEQTTCELVKEKGKWLIIKETSKKVN